MQSIQLMLTIIVLVILVAAWIQNWRDRLLRQAKQQDLLLHEENMRRALCDFQNELEVAQCSNILRRQLLDTVHDAVFLFSAGADETPSPFLDANQAACQLLEISREEVLKLTPMDIELVREPELQQQQSDVELLSISNSESTPRNSAFGMKSMQRIIKNARRGENTVYESSIINQSGRRIPVMIAVGLLKVEPLNRIYYIIKDISIQQRLERNLHNSEVLFKTFFNNALFGAALYDAQHKLISVNNACLRIFGSPQKDEFIKFNPFLTEIVPPGIRERIRHGENVDCEVVVDFNKMLSSGGFVTNRRDKASIEFYFQNLGKDSQHHPIGYLLQILDQTDLRENETALQLREAQLRQAQKMEAIGTMTGGIAHDFNNILTPILGYAEIGLEICDKNSRLYEFIREIRGSSLRAKELVHQILVFSRQNDEVNTQIHLAPIIKEVAKQQSSVLHSKNIKVNYVIRSDDDLAVANPTQIHQILTNFSTNAAYAMRECGGQLDLQLSRFNMGWRHRQEFPNLKKGSYLRISVKDTGKGIPENIRERVFDPFFSTKPAGEGTGMGLAVVKGIVDSLGGGISLESIEGEGTTIHVALPLVDTPAIEETDSWTPAPSGGQRILFVDDESSITGMAKPMLETLGYEPVVCCSSLKALDLFKQSPESIDLLISDQVMPDLSGSELVQAVREIRADLPVIICSGFSGNFTAEAVREMGIDALLVKPVSRRELGEAITRALRTPPKLTAEKTTGQPPDHTQTANEL